MTKEKKGTSLMQRTRISMFKSGQQQKLKQKEELMDKIYFALTFDENDTAGSVQMLFFWSKGQKFQLW